MNDDRDFRKDLKAIFDKHSTEEVQPRKARYDYLPTTTKRFNVMKQTESGAKFVEFGITINDAFRGIDGRFKDTDTVKYRIVPAKDAL
jgi:hypothetical protein